ncbi:capsular associated protein [Entomortierella beljakovae]|nr:capsular associated protein [Entomortierella beljakovae]
MTVAYKPVPSTTTDNRQSNGDDIERGEDYTPTKPSFQLTILQRQFVAIFLFFGLLCLWISLKMMESNHHPLLRTTNTLLNTNDLYQSLTLPLLELSNRTNLISSRCSSTSLPPHLLSFVSNDLSDQLVEEGEVGASPPKQQQRQLEEQQHTNEPIEIRKPLRYLLALVVQDSKSVLPDLLSRVLEVIAVLGPDNCHLSIVNHASTDHTGEMLKVLTQFLDRYNDGDVEILSGMNMEDSNNRDSMNNMNNMKHKESNDNNNGPDPMTKKKHHHLAYTIKTLTTRDTSPQNIVKIRNMAINPHSDGISVLEGRDQNSIVVVNDKKTAAAGKRDEEPLFDSVVILDPVITCSEDILELVFQSQLQDADLTCGMDLSLMKGVPGDSNASEKSAMPLDHEEYDTTVTTDMLGQRLHSDGQHLSIFSTDPDTQERFEKRLPFQVESCWSSVVVLRASALSLMNQNKQLFHLETAQQIQQQQQKQKECQLLDERVVLSYDLWDLQNVNSSVQTPPTPRMVVVPTIEFTHSAKNYAHFGRFSGWGLWPKTEKKYRDELEAQLKAAIHPMYGYKASTSSYGYISRVEEEEITLLTIQDNDESKDGNVQETKTSARANESMERLMISEDLTAALKSKLEEIAAVFGVQDIQNAVMAKRETELIDEWRNRLHPQSIEC